MGFFETVACALNKIPARLYSPQAVPYRYIRSSSRSGFAQAAAISFLICAK